MTDEAKTPDNEGFSEKIYRDITGRDISEHGPIEISPDRVGDGGIPGIVKDAYEKALKDAHEKEIEDGGSQTYYERRLNELEARYGERFAAEHGSDSYEQLAEYYINIRKINYDLGVFGDEPDPSSRDKFDNVDLKDYENLDTYEELRERILRQWEDTDKHQQEKEASAENVEEMLPPESARDEGPLEYLRNLSGTTEEDELEKDVEAARQDPPGSEVAPIEGAASRLMGGEALPTDTLRDETFSGKEQGAPDAAPADAGDVGESIEDVVQNISGIGDAPYRKENHEEDIIQEETQNQNIDTQDVQGEASVQNEAQEYQGINTQEQSTFEAAPEQSVSSTEAQWSVDQDQLLDPYEEEPSSIPKDQLLNPYEDDPSPIPKDELLNPYEDEPSSIPEDQLLNPYEDDPSSIPEDQLLNPYEDDPDIDL